jgi:hypothetical protein
VAFDGFSDLWFKTTKRYDLLLGWWNNDILFLLGDVSFRARLIPLNKVWPDIPHNDEFRPIVVVSPVVKWLESRFLPKLQ